MKKYNAINRILLVAKDKPVEKIGEIVVRSGADERWEKILQGEVISIGEKAAAELGDVKAGSRVFFDKFAETPVHKLDDGRELVAVTAENILMVVS